MKSCFLLPFVLAVACNPAQSERLVFSPDNFRVDSLVMPDGRGVNFLAYENIYYVTEVKVSTYQKLSIYVSEGAKKDAPVFLRIYVGGFMAGTAPNAILDLKAAVRYLRFNDSRILGDSRKIITDGTSAGGVNYVSANLI